jgi:predicted ribosome quality control (RQC) complex YloA/Tae2 family protein
MPLDAVYLTALTRELSQRLAGARIDKIQMPEGDTLLLSVRSAGENLRLLLSPAAAHACT